MQNDNRHTEKDLTKNVFAKLHSIRNRWNALEASKYLLRGIGLLLAGGIFLSLLEGYFWFPVEVKFILMLALFCSVITLFTLSGHYLYRILSKTAKPDDIEIAGWIGKSSPEIRDRLRNAIQLLRDRKKESAGYSNALAAQAFHLAAADLLEFDDSEIIDRNPLQRSLQSTLISAATLLFFMLPVARQGFYRISNPFTHFQKPFPFALSIEPESIQAIEGDTLTLTASAQGGSPGEVTFRIKYFENHDGQTESRLSQADKNSQFTLVIPSAERAFDYWVESGRVASPIYHADVRKPPMVRSFNLKLNPPTYSQLPPMKLEENVGDVLALAGTNIEFQIESRGEISRAFVEWHSFDGKTDTIEFNTRNAEASGRMRIRKSGTYTMRLQAPDGLMNRYPIEYRVDILGDLSPVVDIIQPGIDLEIGSAGMLKLLIEAEDDFGIGAFRLFHRINSEFDTENEREFKSSSLRFRKDSDDLYRSEYLWDLSELKLIPGDAAEYFVRVWDNDNINGPKSADSRKYFLRLPTMLEMFEDVAQNEAQGMEKIEKALENSRELQEHIEKAIDEMKRKGDLDWSQKRDLQEDMKSQKEMLDKLQEAKEAIDDMLDRAEESSLMSMELLEKYSELQKLMSEIASPELQKAMERMSEALEKADPEKLRQAMEMFQQSQEEMLKQIEKSLEILKQLKLERQLEELAERANEMSERQDAVNDSLEKAGAKEMSDLTKEENALEKDMEDWLETLKETQELAAEKDSITASELGEVNEESESLPQEMAQMSGEMMQNQKQSSREKGKKISQKLSKMSQKLSKIKDDAVQRKKDELAGEMLAAVRDMVSISKQQEALMQESGKISERSSRFPEQAALQSSIAEGMEKITDELFRLSQKSFFITPEIGRSLGNAATQMKSAIDNYTARNPRGVTPQQKKAMESVNRASNGVLDALANMQGSSSSTGFAELMEKLKEMSEQQSGLNQSTQGMAMPMPGDGSMSMDQMAQMGRLAAQQRALQQAMQDAAQMSQQMDGVMGDLGEIGNAMGEAADSLEDRHVGDRTLKLQERILSRLLDAQKSVRTQRVSKERRSNTGEDLVRKSPGDIPEDTLEEMMRRDLIRAMKEGYSPDYQKLIREYFRALYGKDK